MIWRNVNECLPMTYKKNGEINIVLIKTLDGYDIDYISHPKDGNLWCGTGKEFITHWAEIPDPEDYTN